MQNSDDFFSRAEQLQVLHVTYIDEKIFLKECIHFKTLFRIQRKINYIIKFDYIFLKPEFRRTIPDYERYSKNLFLYGGYQLFGREIVFISQKELNVFKIYFCRETIDFSAILCIELEL